MSLDFDSDMIIKKEDPILLENQQYNSSVCCINYYTLNYLCIYLLASYYLVVNSNFTLE